MPTLLISTVGTSLLTNQAQDRGVIFKHANARSFDDIPSPDRETLRSLIEQVQGTLRDASESEAAKMSAELNGILAFARDTGSLPDHAMFIATDTALGQVTAELAADWVLQRGGAAEVHRATDIQTADPEAFRMGVSELLSHLAQTGRSYRESGYRVVLNLTGGFKGVNGFIQAAAPMVADEVVYIFERTGTLLRIPILPLAFDAGALVEEHGIGLRRLALDLSVQADALPALFADQVDHELDLSPFAKLVLSLGKEQAYGGALLDNPAPELVRYGPKFAQSVHGLPADRMRQINERIDDLIRHLAQGAANLSRLDFKPLKGDGPAKRRPSTHECDAWADGDVKRLFLHRDDGVWVIDALDAALH